MTKIKTPKRKLTPKQLRVVRTMNLRKDPLSFCKPQSLKVGGVRVHVNRLGAITLIVKAGTGGESLQSWHDKYKRKIKKFVKAVHKGKTVK